MNSIEQALEAGYTLKTLLAVAYRNRENTTPCELHIPREYTQNFAKGGLVQKAKDVKNAGPMNDKVLIHVNTQEYKDLVERLGEPSINPETGLPAFGILSAIGSVFHAITGAVKSVVSTVTEVLGPVGTMALTAAASFLLGPEVGSLMGVTGETAASMGSVLGISAEAATATAGSAAINAMVGLGTGGVKGALVGGASGLAGGVLGQYLGGSVANPGVLASALGGGATGALAGQVVGKGIVGGLTGALTGQNPLKSAALSAAMTGLLQPNLGYAAGAIDDSLKGILDPATIKGAETGAISGSMTGGLKGAMLGSLAGGIQGSLAKPGGALETIRNTYNNGTVNLPTAKADPTYLDYLGSEDKVTPSAQPTAKADSIYLDYLGSEDKVTPPAQPAAAKSTFNVSQIGIGAPAGTTNVPANSMEGQMYLEDNPNAKASTGLSAVLQGNPGALASAIAGGMTIGSLNAAASAPPTPDAAQTPAAAATTQPANAWMSQPLYSYNAQWGSQRDPTKAPKPLSWQDILAGNMPDNSIYTPYYAQDPNSSYPTTSTGNINPTSSMTPTNAAKGGLMQLRRV